MNTLIVFLFFIFVAVLCMSSDVNLRETTNKTKFTINIPKYIYTPVQAKLYAGIHDSLWFFVCFTYRLCKRLWTKHLLEEQQ